MDFTLASGKKVPLLKNTVHPPAVSYVDPVREELVVDILNRLQLGDSAIFLQFVSQ